MVAVMPALLFAVFSMTTAVATITDIRTKTLPRRLSLGMLVCAVLFVMVEGGVAAAFTVGFVTTGFLAALNYWRPDGIGFGDVIFVLPLGVMLGAVRDTDSWYWGVGLTEAVTMLLVAFAASVLASVVTRTRKLPFGPFLVLGFVVTVTNGAVISL